MGEQTGFDRSIRNTVLHQPGHLLDMGGFEMVQHVLDEFVHALRWELCAYDQVHKMIWNTGNEPAQVAAQGQFHAGRAPKAVMIIFPILCNSPSYQRVRSTVTQNGCHPYSPDGFLRRSSRTR